MEQIRLKRNIIKMKMILIPKKSNQSQEFTFSNLWIFYIDKSRIHFWIFLLSEPWKQHIIDCAKKPWNNSLKLIEMTQIGNQMNLFVRRCSFAINRKNFTYFSCKHIVTTPIPHRYHIDTMSNYRRHSSKTGKPF